MRPQENFIIEYDKPDGWVAYTEHEEVIHATAHSYENKYSVGMLRALKRVLDIKDILVTELVYNYLVDFYSKHYKVTHLGQNYYKVEKG